MMKVCLSLLLGLVAMASAYAPYYGYGYPGYYGYYPHNGYHGYAAVDNYNHEFDYRQFGGYPVHVGDGRFAFLGTYGGHCGHASGFYFTADHASFVVCDHGRAHRFACPKGTQNRDHAHFTVNHAYGLTELCGVNLNDQQNAAH